MQKLGVQTTQPSTPPKKARFKANTPRTPRQRDDDEDSDNMEDGAEVHITAASERGKRHKPGQGGDKEGEQ